ncbi:uncharacterized protein SPPG_08937 [Spizellomyces punctatus DAOM BR117]|uniref:DUF1772 domain-containing protein n=1 Tax=Spizellomyces punctatus (strain DAOM BR117) TaxID=645134 RepID=A0A0L0HT42_SPIPD|nr:uncharacterized protein SPPG_08937 [Spizellomyces punctatus DAOM BR117]KND04044.1 hypothetical protein SPPG_08937 [Spizellomyces punctatus DAOM BR117]|eukprot:XP_016612083.1 hypothetical protein SPPG_08937 [Spizellomyces punctatus DAOM BR117]
MHLADQRVIAALESAATISAGLFTGAASYITLVEQPARFKSSAETARRNFQHTYPLAARMQASLALVAGGSSLVLALLKKSTRYYVAAAAFLSIPVFTIACIFPTNNRLLSGKDQDANAHGVWGVLRKWGLLHGARVVAAAAGFGALVIGRTAA